MGYLDILILLVFREIMEVLIVFILMFGEMVWFLFLFVYIDGDGFGVFILVGVIGGRLILLIVIFEFGLFWMFWIVCELLIEVWFNVNWDLFRVILFLFRVVLDFLFRVVLDFLFKVVLDFFFLFEFIVGRWVDIFLFLISYKIIKYFLYFIWKFVDLWWR